MAEKDKVRVLPLVPLKNSVLFPGLLMPLAVGRPASLAAVEAALATEEKEIVVVAQRSSETDSPSGNDLFTIGTKAVIRKMIEKYPEDHPEAEWNAMFYPDKKDGKKIPDDDKNQGN